MTRTTSIAFTSESLIRILEKIISRSLDAEGDSLVFAGSQRLHAWMSELARKTTIHADHQQEGVSTVGKDHRAMHAHLATCTSSQDRTRGARSCAQSAGGWTERCLDQGRRRSVSVRQSHLERGAGAKDARVHFNSWWTRGHYRTAS